MRRYAPNAGSRPTPGLKRIELVLIAIVFLLLFGEGTVVEVVNRLVVK